MRPNRASNLIIIVNDNEMSIAEDFGGMYGQLAKLRTSNGMAELNLFKSIRLGLPLCGAG